MRYIFDLCPKCKDKLIQRTTKDSQEYKEIYCSNCGNRMDTVLLGNKKAGNTIYKIILNQVRDINGKRDRCLKAIMQIDNLDENEALEKINTKDSVIFEGDLLNTYLSMRHLDEIDDMVDYSVIPDFPYARAFGQKCPDCGEEAVYKIEEVSENKLQKGFFCEKCNNWVWYDICDKLQIDKTLYHVKVSLKGVGGQVRQDIMRMLNGLCVKETVEDQIVVHDLARNIESLLGLMKTYNIDYEINPPYPYKIIEFMKEWTEDDIKKLMTANPGVTVTVEDMNALS